MDEINEKSDQDILFQLTETPLRRLMTRLKNTLHRYRSSQNSINSTGVFFPSKIIHVPKISSVFSIFTFFNLFVK